MDDDQQQQQDARPQIPVEPPTFKAPRMISRPKPPVQQDEEIGTELKLGDFEGEQPLSISEAHAVVKAVHEKRREKIQQGHGVDGNRVHNDSQSIQQFVEYLEMFARYKQHENLLSMSSVLDSNPQFTTVERAMLGSLCCDTADEAKTLIPSLAPKMDDEPLQQTLDELQKLQDRFG